MFSPKESRRCSRELLSDIPLFNGLADSVTDQLLAASRVVSIPAHTQILSVQSPVKEAFVLVRGTLRELSRLLARNQTTIVVNDAVFGVGMTGVAVALALVLLGGGLITPGVALTALLLALLLVEPLDKVGRQFYVGLAGGARPDRGTSAGGGRRQRSRQGSEQHEREPTDTKE